ncbi:MAG: Gfo/Idh/MocA family oxidoreductase [Acidobacteriota bacterium]
MANKRRGGENRSEPTRSGSKKVRYGVVGLGWFAQVSILPAFEFAEGMSHRLTIGGKTREKKFEKRDQIAPEILTFSECIMTGREPEPSGREGLADVRVIRALYKSAKTGRSVTLPPFEKRQRPGRKQEIRRPPGRPQELVHADPPSGEI